MRRSGETGQITVVTLGFLLVLGLLTVVVVNTSAAFLQRRDLLNLADRAALAAADAIAHERIYREGVDADVALDPAQARRIAASVLPSGTGVELRIEGDIVHVWLERGFTVPIRPPGWNGGTTLTAESAAQLRLAAP